jgi:hypothetical protein
MICFDCLNENGGEDRRCPGICDECGHSDLEGDKQRDLKGFCGEPSYVRGAFGKTYPAGFVENFPVYSR